MHTEFETLFNLSPDPMVIIDSKGTFLAVNDKVVEVTRFSKEEFLGKNFQKMKIVTGKSKAILIKNLMKRMLGLTIDPYEIEILTKDRNKVITEVNAAKIKYKGKTADLVVFRDITARRQTIKALRESEEMYKTLVKTSPDAITVTDPDGVIIEASEQTLNLHGYKKYEELLGKHFIELVTPEHHKKALTNLEKILEVDSQQNIEYILMRKDGTTFIGEINIALIRDGEGKPKAFITTTRDITEKTNLMKMKDNFISIVTHELRTPLVSIKGYIEYILADKQYHLPDTITSNLQIIKRNSDLLVNITNDLLDIRHMELGKLQLNKEPLNYRDIITKSIEYAKPFMKEKNQQLHTALSKGALHIQGDHNRLHQVLNNLLSNASKFSPEGSNIYLTIIKTKQSIKTQVSDKGIGIRKKDLKEVFEPFSFIEKSTYFKGTGLGLSVAKGLIESHGGKIWGESTGEGKGSTFTFTLPLLKGRIKKQIIT